MEGRERAWNKTESGEREEKRFVPTLRTLYEHSRRKCQRTASSLLQYLKRPELQECSLDLCNDTLF